MRKATVAVLSILGLVIGALALNAGGVRPDTGAAAVAEPARLMPLIGEKAPPFEAVTTQGPIRFPDDFKGKWVVFFSHPADFTPVCTTEFIAFAGIQNDLRAMNTELLGLSVDGNASHIAWLRTIRDKIAYKGQKGVEVRFPLIADVKMEVAKRYGMLQPSASNTNAVRAVFVIDPTATVRAILYYPLTNGRYMPEIKRLVQALQTTDEFKVATPANWQPGDEVVMPAPGTMTAADARVKDPGPDAQCLDWFLSLKKLPARETKSDTGGR